MIVQNKGNYIRHFGTVRLVPGVNQLGVEDIKAFKTSLGNKLNNFLVDSGEIIFEESKKITDRKADEIIELVSDTYDLDALGQFLNEEENRGSKKRATVINAIQNQIEAIKNPNKDDIVDPPE